MSEGYLAEVIRFHDSAIERMLLILFVYIFAESLSIAGDQHDQQELHHESGEMHSHDKWITPPDTYQNKVINNWDDREAANRGKKLYKQHCFQCHGADGTGRGPLASPLEHPPANLTNHFHKSAGNGDAYLYWRISEGGRVEPFASMKSLMPSFKMILSEEDRWDILIYVHQAFHKSFITTKNDGIKADHMEHQH